MADFRYWGIPRNLPIGNHFIGEVYTAKMVLATIMTDTPKEE